MTVKIKTMSYCDSICFRQSFFLLVKDGYEVCGLGAGGRIGLGEDCLFMSLIFTWQPSINT